MANLPWVPGIYSHDNTIAEMILRSGQDQANRQERMGQQIAGSVQDIGGAIGQGLQQRKAEQEKKKQEAFQFEQDKAFVTRISDQSNPITLRDTIGIYGPQKGLVVHKAYEALQGPKPDLKVVLAGFEAVGPLGRAAGWPAARQHLVEAGAQSDMLPPPDKFDEDWYGRFKVAALGQKPEEEFTLTPGGKRFRGDKQIAENPAEAKAPTFGHVETAAGIQAFDPTTGKLGPVIAPGKPNAPREPKEPNWQEAVGPGGKPILFDEASGRTKPYPEGVSPKPTARERAVTGQERTALGFYNRAKEATENIAPLEDKIAGLGVAGQARLKYAHNYFQTEEGQKYNQAQKEFTEARLRKESGAQVAKSEYENDALTYFAQPGDGKAVLEQKRKARGTVLRGLQIGAGRAYAEYYGEDPMTPKNQAPFTVLSITKE